MNGAFLPSTIESVASTLKQTPRSLVLLVRDAGKEPRACVRQTCGRADQGRPLGQCEKKWLQDGAERGGRARREWDRVKKGSHRKVQGQQAISSHPTHVVASLAQNVTLGWHESPEGHGAMLALCGPAAMLLDPPRFAIVKGRRQHVCV